MSLPPVPSLFCVPSKQLQKCQKYRMKDPKQQASHSSTLSPALRSLSPGSIPRLLEQSLRSWASEPNDLVQSHTLLFPSCETLTAAAPSCLLSHAKNWDSGGVCAPVN